MDWPTTGNKSPLHPLLIANLNPHCAVKAGAQVRAYPHRLHHFACETGLFENDLWTEQVRPTPPSVRRSARSFGDQPFKVSRPDLPAGHGLLDRRHFQQHAQYCGHRPMAGERTLVEDQVLQLSPLDGHNHRAVGGIERRDHAGGPGLEVKAC